MGKEFNLILDFDHTLFDTVVFLEAAQEIAKCHGVSKKQFYKTFSDITDGRNDSPYSFNDHVESFSVLIKTTNKALLTDLISLHEKSSLFLYPDSKPFLKRIRKWNISMHLVTFSNLEMRRCQLTATGIDKMFDYIHIIDTSRKDKIMIIRDIIGSSFASSIIDDHPAILKPLEDLPVLAIRLRRRVYRRYLKTEPSLPGVPVFAGLNNAYLFLEPILRTFGKRVNK